MSRGRISFVFIKKVLPIFIRPPFENAFGRFNGYEPELPQFIKSLTERHPDKPHVSGRRKLPKSTVEGLSMSWKETIHRLRQSLRTQRLSINNPCRILFIRQGFLSSYGVLIIHICKITCSRAARDGDGVQDALPNLRASLRAHGGSSGTFRSSGRFRAVSPLWCHLP